MLNDILGNDHFPFGSLVSDAYFPRAQHTAELAGANPWVRYNVFIRKDGILCGMRYVTEAITYLNRYYLPPTERVHLFGLKDGEPFRSGEPVARIEGRFQHLVALETSLLGFLTLSGPATGMHEVVRAADGVPVVDMSTRHYFAERAFNEALVYAAHIGGASGTSSPEGWLAIQALQDGELSRVSLRSRPALGFMQYLFGGAASSYWAWMQTACARAQDSKTAASFQLVGTIPHALNAVLGGSIPAAEAFRKAFPEEKLTVLVDYEGRELDMVREAVEKFGKDLYAVRLDTHGDRVHQGGVTEPRDLWVKAYPALAPTLLASVHSYFETDLLVDLLPRHYLCGPGVTLEAYLDVRDLLDGMGAQHVKIVLSSGFNAKKTAAFRPFIDPERTVIGSGSWVGSMDYHPTGDIVEINEGTNREGPWRPCLKVGREYTPSTRLTPLVA